MTEKSELIKQMLALQKKYIEYEQTHGVSQSEYYNPPADHPLHGYKDQYAEMANRVLELAHGEKGSKR
ncbi:MAG: hypothetical protein OES09_08175 [Gammaproteobacteria bacterium]|nr:hypothetical protein [Gammaproteobacteria bacterium]